MATLTAARFTNKAGTFSVSSNILEYGLTPNKFQLNSNLTSGLQFQRTTIDKTNVLMLGTQIDVSTNNVVIRNNTTVNLIDGSDLNVSSGSALNLNSGSALNLISGSALDLSSGSALNAKYGSSLNLSSGSALSWNAPANRSVTLGPTVSEHFTNLTAKQFVCKKDATSTTAALSIEADNSTKLPLVTIGSMTGLSSLTDTMVVNGNIYISGDIKYTGSLQGQNKTKPSPIPTPITGTPTVLLSIINKINEIIAYL